RERRGGEPPQGPAPRGRAPAADSPRVHSLFAEPSADSLSRFRRRATLNRPAAQADGEPECNATAIAPEAFVRPVPGAHVGGEPEPDAAAVAPAAFVHSFADA